MSGNLLLVTRFLAESSRGVRERPVVFRDVAGSPRERPAILWRVTGGVSPGRGRLARSLLPIE
ncbi:MAG: hypothetical protein LBG30_02060 [Odoribacteraceae bacterium]|nr:hypothetical protein [Odoribacteraceae bacterium]